MKSTIKIQLLVFFFLGISVVFAQTKKYTISGYVYEKGSKESLIGVNIYVPELRLGTSTNNYGFYSITLPEGVHQVYYSFVGYQSVSRNVSLDKNISQDVYIQEDELLDEVVIKSKKRKKISQISQMSQVDIPISQIKDIPALLGEKDVLKTLQLMPGVQSGSEGNSGIYVRGGGPDQNLIILDDAPVYNANHLFGFFSIFNGDALKSVSLTKGGFPAHFGGRLSSVLEMNMKDGNKQEIKGEAGIGLISSRFTLEGPIVKDKSSFLVSGRRTYIDILSRPFMDKNDKVGYYFYDFNAKANYEIDRNNKIYLSGYFGRDNFYSKYENEFNSDNTETGLYWGNATTTLRWNHMFNNKVFSNTSLIFSDYIFSIFKEDNYENNNYQSKYYSGIQDIGAKFDLQYVYSPNYTIKTGFASTAHKFTPSAIIVKDKDVNKNVNEIKAIRTVESGLYIENELKFWNKLRINAGFRLSHYYHKDTSYINSEPRFSASYSLTNDFSTKLSFASMNQYVHLLSSTGINLPLDLWVPTTGKIQPQKSNQFAFGLAKDFTEQNFSFSAEGYYKKMDNIVGYKPGANFLLLDELGNAQDYLWEDSVIRGQGWSYGVELLLQRKVGRLSGWLGYTLSWTQHQFDEVNGGEKYDARYDRRHDLSLVGIYKLSDNITLSGTWVYGTGNAISLPTEQYILDQHNNQRNHYQNYKATSYGRKNSFRMRAYHRLDLGVQFHKIRQKYERTWEIGLYNAYSRKNPFFYEVHKDYDNQGQFRERNKLKQISIFPIIPSITYNIKF